MAECLKISLPWRVAKWGIPSAMMIRSVKREHSRSTITIRVARPIEIPCLCIFQARTESKPKTVGSPKLMNCPIQTYMKALESGSVSPNVAATHRQR